jgi:predicted dienelactone hydrolase
MATLVDYAGRGPHPVGVTTLELRDPANPSRVIPTDVWYPADPAGWDASAEADHPIGAPHAARADAAPARPGGACPLVAFSHGNSGFRRQSTFLTTHLASWGMVVTAPDHTGNTFFEMLEVASEDERIRIHKDARRNRPADLRAAIDAVVAGGAWPQVDASRVAAVGHSYGGWTALKMPRRDPRIRAVCGLAPASEPFVGRKAFDPDELPLACPSLIFPALDDVLVDLETSVRPLFERLERSLLVGLRNADHFHFCDHLALIHGLHEKNSPRPKQTRPTRPYAELLDEARSHRAIRGVVTAFVAAALADAPHDGEELSRQALYALDPEIARLDEVPA